MTFVDPSGCVEGPVVECSEWENPDWQDDMAEFIMAYPNWVELNAEEKLELLKAFGFLIFSYATMAGLPIAAVAGQRLWGGAELSEDLIRFADGDRVAFTDLMLGIFGAVGPLKVKW